MRIGYQLIEPPMLADLLAKPAAFPITLPLMHWLVAVV